MVRVVAEGLHGDADQKLEHLGPGETGLQERPNLRGGNPTCCLHDLAREAGQGLEPGVGEGRAGAQRLDDVLGDLLQRREGRVRGRASRDRQNSACPY